MEISDNEEEDLEVVNTIHAPNGKYDDVNWYFLDKFSKEGWLEKLYLAKMTKNNIQMRCESKMGQPDFNIKNFTKREIKLIHNKYVNYSQFLQYFLYTSLLKEKDIVGSEYVLLYKTKDKTFFESIIIYDPEFTYYFYCPLVCIDLERDHMEDVRKIARSTDVYDKIIHVNYMFLETGIYYFCKKDRIFTGQMAKNKSTSKAFMLKKTKVKKIQTLPSRGQLIVFDNTYYTIKKIIFNASMLHNKAVPNLVKLKPFFKKHGEYYYVAYDLETIELEGKSYPYILSFCYQEHQSGEIITKSFNSNPFNKEEYNIIENNIFYKFFEYIANETKMADFTYVLFGYNNFRFDDEFLLEYLSTLGKDSWLRCKRYGKTSVFEITKNSTEYNLYFILKDITTWIPNKNLKQACDDYEITNAKIGFDIMKYNRLCIELGCLVEYVSIPCFNEFISKFTLMEKRGFHQQCAGRIPTERNLFKLATIYAELDSTSAFELYLKLVYNLELLKTNFFENWEFNFENALTIIKKKGLTIETTKAEIQNDNYKLMLSGLPAFMSPSQFAFSLLTSFWSFKYPDMKFIKSNNFSAALLRLAYYGGKVDYNIIGKYEGDIGYYDITSSYPNVMSGLFPFVNQPEDFIIGYDINVIEVNTIINSWIKKRNEVIYSDNEEGWTNFKWMEEFQEKINGIFHIVAAPPEDKTQLIFSGPLPERDFKNGTLYYPNKAIKGRYCIWDIRSAILFGWKITVIPCSSNILFKQVEPIFKEFIKFFNVKKTAAKEDGNSSLSKLFKLLSNSIAGKIGQLPKNEIKMEMYNVWEGGGTEAFVHHLMILNNINLQNIKAQSKKTEILAKAALENKLCFMDGMDKMTFAKSNSYLAEKSTCFNFKPYIYLACYVTAMGRWQLNKMFYLINKDLIKHKAPLHEKMGIILYCDTDSIIVNNKYMKDVKLNFSNDIAEWNPEIYDFNVNWGSKHPNEIKKIYILGKKSYVLFDNNKILDVVIKGVFNATKDQVTEDSLNEIIKAKSKGQVISFETLARSYDKSKLFMNIYSDKVTKTIKTTMSNHKQYETTNPFIINSNKVAIQNELLRFYSGLE